MEQERPASGVPAGDTPAGDAPAGESPAGEAGQSGVPTRDEAASGNAASGVSAAVVSSGTVAASRRLVESFTIAVVTSTGLYLVGSVYVDAYYGRMSIDSTSLDLPPTHIGLQATHMLQGLLSYPTTILVLYVVVRLLSARVEWLRLRYHRLRQRFGRVVLLIANLLIITPFAVDAVRAVDERSVPGASVVSEASVLLSNVLLVLVIYMIWLSLGPRELVFTPLRQRKLLPIALIALAYLLSALIATADTGARAAELFMLGLASNSVQVEFTMDDGLSPPAADTELLLVIARNSTYYVVERQAFPPPARPTAYVVPFDTVTAAKMRRLTDAEVELEATSPEFLSVYTEMQLDALRDAAATPAATP